jgi:hypothetical protein
MVAWPKVTRPVELGELGVLDLATLRHALRLRWAWLARVDPIRTWTALPVASDKIERAMFEASTSVVVGCGSMEGQSIISLTPDLVTAVDRRAFRDRTVAQALQDDCWVAYITGSLSALGLQQYLVLWNVSKLSTWRRPRQTGSCGNGRRRINTLASSAYRAFFIGQTGILGAKELHKVRVPPVSKIFVWLALLVRCWKSERCSALCVLAN